MRRTKKKPEFKKADAILTGDIELRAFTPTCRIDDHWEAQSKKIAWLKDLQEKHGCPVLDSGDLFDKRYKTNPSHALLRWAIHNLPDKFLTVPGNHDLPGKSYENYRNSAMCVLEGAERLRHYADRYLLYSDEFAEGAFIAGFHYGCEMKQIERFNVNGWKIALVHAMVYDKFEPWPGCEGYSAKEIMDLLPDFDLIVTGHHHATFARQHNGRVLVNPGSFMRNDADQENHKPCVFLWYGDTNTIEKVYIPIEQGVIDRSYLDVKKNKETRLDAFVEKLGEQAVSGINFHNNLETTIKKNVIGRPVVDKIWQYYEGI